MSISINLIGAGKLGKTIGYLVTRTQTADIKGVVNRSPQSTLEAIQFIGAGHDYATIASLPHADITLITTPDETIATSCQALCLNQQLRPGDIVAHCSGTLSSDSLAWAKQRGCVVASIHPLRSFANPALSAQNYAGTYCAIEGDLAAVEVLNTLFTSIGSKTYTINKDKKALYHAGSVVASNYVVALAQEALDSFTAAGVDEQTAMLAVSGLMRSTVLNLETTLSPHRSLTGPIQRGDVATIQTHLDALTDSSLYRMLGKKTLQISALDDEKKREIDRIL